MTVVVNQTANRVVVTQKVATVSAQAVGLQGPKGDTGATGPSGVGTYTHEQAVASTTWVIVHNLDAFPSVSIVDTAGTVWVSSIHYDSANQITITHSAAFAGRAFLN